MHNRAELLDILLNYKKLIVGKDFISFIFILIVSVGYESALWLIYRIGFKTFGYATFCVMIRFVYNKFSHLFPVLSQIYPSDIGGLFMNKTLLIVMILSLLFSVLGCDQKQQEKTDEKPITTATTAVQDATTTTAATTAATTATTAATVSTSTDANDTLSSDTSFGSRNSPVKVGETVSLQSTSFAFDITLNSITRGADATNLVKDSTGAPPIPAGKELIIANITLILNKSECDSLTNRSGYLRR